MSKHYIALSIIFPLHFVNMSEHFVVYFNLPMLSNYFSYLLHCILQNSFIFNFIQNAAEIVSTLFYSMRTFLLLLYTVKFD